MGPEAVDEPGRQTSMALRGAHLAGFLVATLLVGVLGAFVTQPAITDGWYDALDKPAWTPPNWVFGPAWTSLYILMAIAAWRVWDVAGWQQGRDAFLAYGVQLALNFGWSLVFFGLEQPGWAFLEILVLLGAIGVTIWLFWKQDRVAAYLMIPYIAWVVFAAALNLAVWLMN